MIITKRADTQEIQNDFKILLRTSLLDEEDSRFLGKINWSSYLEELISNEEEMSQSCYVSYVDDIPIGYVVASLNETEYIYLSEIYVIPQARGMGYAKNMLRDVLKMNEASKVHAYVHEDNKAMQHVLESLGASHSGKWYDYVLNG